MKSAKLLSCPDKFLEVRVSRLDLTPTLYGLCAGYEEGRWRSEEFARHLMEWLPEFALNYSDAHGITSGNAVRLLRDAALRVYQSDKFQKRGEFGELLLHAIIRQEFETVPAISKIYYKDSANNTVKGFDAVHVAVAKTGLELWLGEAKFYDNFSRAVSSVVKELAQHTKSDFLRNEFALLINKIDSEWPYADRLKKLLSPNTSLDQVFDALCVPILLTYDSPILASHDKVTSKFCADFSKEIETHHATFKTQSLPKNARVHLILVPLHTKKQLVADLDKELKRWQGR